MASPNVLSLVAQATISVSVPESATHAIADDFEGPASAPTILVEVEAGTVIPTALPAPPLVPTLAEAWHPPPSAPLPVVRRPELTLVEAPSARISRRPTVRVGEVRSKKLRVVRPSNPPTNPPSGRPMRQVA
ncbi:MAG TPA: hypothetical protein VM925_22065 [Labilithrix sp.]|nr:hypothetical protein [Labilithrix sp.]